MSLYSSIWQQRLSTCPSCTSTTFYLRDKYPEQSFSCWEFPACFWPQSKCFSDPRYEEIYPPPMDDYLAVADGAFTKEELLHYESEVIIVLDFRLVRST